MAQLVARLTGSQKVRDSNSLVSTNDGLLLGRNKKERTVYVLFFVASYCYAVLVYGNGNSSNYIALRFTALTLRLCLGTNSLVSTKRHIRAHLVLGHLRLCKLPSHSHLNLHNLQPFFAVWIPS